MQLNRRNFLKAGIAMGAGAMLTATGCAPQAPAKDGEGVQNETTQKMADTSDITAKWSFETAPDPIPSDAIAKVESTAIVVVGAGPSGFAAALSALDAGESNVVVLAKSPTYNALGGSMHAFNTKTMKSYGYELSDNEISHRLRTEWLHQGNMCDHDKWARAAYASGEAMDWLCAFVEAEGNRTVLEIGPQDDDGIYQTEVGSHSFMGGDIQVAGGGIGIGMSVMEKNILAKGGQILYSTTVEQLIREDQNTGRVTGCIAKTPEGEYVQYNASKGIILATGCITHDDELLQAYAPMTYSAVQAGCLAWAGETNTGDGFKMALWVGAAPQKNYPWATCYQTPALYSAGGSGELQDVSNLWAMYRSYAFYPTLTVNQLGERYMNEDAGMGLYTLPQQRQPDMMSYAIWTDNMAEALEPWATIGQWYGDDCTLPSLSAAEIKAAWDAGLGENMGPANFENAKFDSVEELANHFNIPADTLKATVDRYNECCRQGFDPDFAKRPDLLIEIQEGKPIYCMKYMPIIENVFGGPACDVNARVLDTEGNPIPGLYEVGVMMGDLYGTVYTFLFPGANMGFWNITYGYLTGKGVAEGTI